MKIETKKIRLAAVAFACGFLFCALLVVVTQQTSPPVAASGPRLAFTQVAGGFVIQAPLEEGAPGLIPMQRDPLLDSTLPRSRPAASLDLIDMRPPRVDVQDIQ